MIISDPETSIALDAALVTLDLDTSEERQIGAFTLLMLIEIAMRSDSKWRHSLSIQLTKKQRFDCVEKFERLALVGAAKDQHKWATVISIRAATAVMTLLSSDNNVTGEQVQLSKQISESARIWERLLQLTKTVQNCVYNDAISTANINMSKSEATAQYCQQCLEELTALFELLNAAVSSCSHNFYNNLPAEHSHENTCDEGANALAFGVLPLVTSTLLSMSQSNPKRGIQSLLQKLRPVVSITSSAAIQLATSLLNSQIVSPMTSSKAVPFSDLLQLVELVSKLMPELTAAASDSKFNQPIRQLASVALDFLCSAVAASPRSLNRVFCTTRLPQKISQNLLLNPPNSTANTAAVVFGQTPPVTERLVLLRLLRSAALLWPSGHHVVITDASNLYLPLLNDWAGSERMPDAMEVLQLLARRGKTARRLGLQQRKSTGSSVVNIKNKRLTPSPRPY